MRMMGKLMITAALAITSAAANAQTPAATPAVALLYAHAPAAAPEIDSRFATEGAFLLMGALMVLRGRRTPQALTVR
jgi:hypothetical protein